MSFSLFLPPQPTISMIEATLLLGVLVAKIAVMMKKIATLKTDTFHAELLKKDSLSRLSSDDWTCDSSSEDDGPPSVSVVDPFIDACTEDLLTELHDKEKEDAPRQLPLPGEEVVRR